MHAFKEYIQAFLGVFMDDLYVYSKKCSKHIAHLKLIFEKCQVYRIYLNLKKCKFMVHQGKIIGNIVFEIGISINVEKISVPSSYHERPCGYLTQMKPRTDCQSVKRMSPG